MLTLPSHSSNPFSSFVEATQTAALNLNRDCPLKIRITHSSLGDRLAFAAIFPVDSSRDICEMRQYTVDPPHTALFFQNVAEAINQDRLLCAQQILCESQNSTQPDTLLTLFAAKRFLPPEMESFLVPPMQQLQIGEILSSSDSDSEDYERSDGLPRLEEWDIYNLSDVEGI